MLAASSRDEFFPSPVGRYLAGPFYLYWCASEELYGVSIWGNPDMQAMASFVEILAVEQRQGARPHATIIDFRHLQAVEAHSFELLTRFIVQSAPRLSEVLHRQALVPPHGMLGALIVGHYERLAPPYEVRVFPEFEAALAWLAPRAGAAWSEDLLRLEHTTRTGDLLLSELRRQLAASRLTADLESAARGLAVSTRSLQRHLHALGTSFVRELRGARLRRAKQLLRETEFKLTFVALEAGFSSVQQLCAAFRQDEGCSPGAFRRQQGAAPGLTVPDGLD